MMMEVVYNGDIIEVDEDHIPKLLELLNSQNPYIASQKMTQQELVRLSDSVKAALESMTTTLAGSVTSSSKDVVKAVTDASSASAAKMMVSFEKGLAGMPRNEPVRMPEIKMPEIKIPPPNPPAARIIANITARDKAGRISQFELDIVRDSQSY